MRLRIDEQRVVPVQVEEEDSYTSRFTGAVLRRLRVTAGGRLRDDIHNAVVTAFQAPTIESVTEGGDVEAVWTPVMRSHSYSGVERSYSIDLSELDPNCEVDRLQIGDLSLVPYRYAEEAGTGDTDIVIKCRVKTSPDDTDQLFDLMLTGDEYLPVIRHGISSEPRFMRFGVNRWSRDEIKGVDKHEIILVERSDNDVRRSPFGLMDHGARAHLAFTRELLEELLGAFREKDILGEDEVEGLRNRAEGKYGKRVMAMRREEDIDARDD